MSKTPRVVKLSFKLRISRQYKIQKQFIYSDNHFQKSTEIQETNKRLINKAACNRLKRNRFCVLISNIGSQ